MKTKNTGYTLFEALTFLVIFAFILLAIIEFNNHISIQYLFQQAHYKISDKAKHSHLFLKQAIPYATPNADQKIVTGNNQTLHILQSPISCSGKQGSYQITLWVEPTPYNYTSLYCKENSGNKQELIEKVRALRLRYIVEKNDIITYQTNVATEDWPHVIRVDAQLLLHVNQPNPTGSSSNQTFSLFDETITTTQKNTFHKLYPFSFELKNHANNI